MDDEYGVIREEAVERGKLPPNVLYIDPANQAYAEGKSRFLNLFTAEVVAGLIIAAVAAVIFASQPQMDSRLRVLVGGVVVFIGVPSLLFLLKSLSLNAGGRLLRGRIVSLDTRKVYRNKGNRTEYVLSYEFEAEARGEANRFWGEILLKEEYYDELKHNANVRRQPLLVLYANQWLYRVL